MGKWQVLQAQWYQPPADEPLTARAAEAEGAAFLAFMGAQQQVKSSTG